MKNIQKPYVKEKIDEATRKHLNKLYRGISPEQVVKNAKKEIDDHQEDVNFHRDYDILVKDVGKNVKPCWWDKKNKINHEQV